MLLPPYIYYTMERFKTNHNRYVLPTPRYLRDFMNEYNFNRLYSFPVVPQPPINDNQFVFLDSGAFALDQYKCQISAEYMQNLSVHYQLYKQPNVFCIAPDSFLNPNRTLYNLKKWVANDLFADINVVFQFAQQTVFDVESIEYLLDEYANIPHSKDIAFIANPRLTGDAAHANYDNINMVCNMIRECGYKWIHMLGAGWDVNCISKWATFIGNAIDSMDSIAYCNAKTYWNYQNLSYHKNVKINNAFVAQKIIQDYAIL